MLLIIAPLAGCVGESSFDSGGETATDTASETDTGMGFPCDVPQLFVDRCSGSICHSGAGGSATSLDLISPGVEDRVSGVPGTGCGGLLANPADPSSSLLYTKLGADPGCGARMPVATDPLSDDEIACVRDWISGLLPPTDTGDTSDTGDCPECVCDPGTEESCYGGPPDTQDVGNCVRGLRVCAPDGLSFGPCEAEIGPQGENCLTADIDEDCDGEMPACTELWSRSFGSYGDALSQNIRSVAVDSSGDIYSVADFQGVVSFGGEPLVATGDKSDIVIAKHDRYGNPVWSKRYGDSSNQYAAKILVDADDNLIVLGRFFGNIDFGGGSHGSEGTDDIVVVKLDSDGNHIWSRSFGGIDPDRAERIAVDSQGNVLVTGAFGSDVDFGSGLFMSAGLRDAFVLKLDGQTGSHVFAVQIGGPGDDYGFGIDAGANDDVVVTGRFQDTVDLGSPLVSAGGRDVFVATFNSDGVLGWAESFGGPGEDGSHDLRVQPQSHDIVLLGFMAGTMSFGGANLVSAGERDIFLATLNQDGGHVWSANYGDASDQFSNTYELNTWMSLALDPSNNILIGGTLLGAASFGGAEISSASENPDVFFAILGADGSFVSNRRYGGIGTDIALDIAVAGNDLVLGGRSFASSLDFGVSGMVSFYGSTDGFIAKLDL